jgi:hypothetical protein
MQSNREAKREDRDDATGTAKHSREANDRLSHCQPHRGWPPRLEMIIHADPRNVAVGVALPVKVSSKIITCMEALVVELII